MNDNQTIFTDLTTFITDTAEEKHVPGVAFGVIVGGRQFTGCLGVTSVEHPLPVTDDTLFQIGSITKTYTALAVFRLIEEERLNLSDRVIQFLPDLELADLSVRNSVTINQLLTHTAGWDGDIFTDTGNGDDALSNYLRLLVDAPQLTPNGTHFSYNNAGFSLLGRIIEIITNESYETALKSLVFDPLKLNNSFFLPSDVMLRRFVAGHLIDAEGVAQVAHPWPIPRGANPAGGIACSIKELLNYAQLIIDAGKLSNGSSLISKQNFNLMVTPQHLVSPTNGSIAHSWFVRGTETGLMVEHGGATNGQASHLAILPDRGFAFGMITNAGTGRMVTLSSLKWALKHYLDVDLPQSIPISGPIEQISQYVGKFSRPMSDFEILIGNEGQLTGQTTYKYALGDEVPTLPPCTLEVVDEDLLVITDTDLKDHEVVLIRDDNNQIELARFQYRLHVRQDPERT